MRARWAMRPDVERIRADQAFVQERDVSGRWSGPKLLCRQAGYGESPLDFSDVAFRHDSPVMILSENSVDHALLTLAAMHVGIPVVPISTTFTSVI